MEDDRFLEGGGIGEGELLQRLAFFGYGETRWGVLRLCLQVVLFLWSTGEGVRKILSEGAKLPVISEGYNPDEVFDTTKIGIQFLFCFASAHPSDLRITSILLELENLSMAGYMVIPSWKNFLASGANKGKRRSCSTICLYTRNFLSNLKELQQNLHSYFSSVLAISKVRWMFYIKCVK